MQTNMEIRQEAAGAGREAVADCGQAGKYRQLFFPQASKGIYQRGKEKSVRSLRN